MRFGLSWDVGSDEEPAPVWRAILGEMSAADGIGLDSAWVDEARDGPASCSQPAMLLTFASRRTASLHLRARRMVGGANVVRVAEEMTVLDVFSRGRAGIVVSSPGAEGIDPATVIERADFLLHAWSRMDFRYRGRSFRFPAHTDDEAPEGASEAPPGRVFQPQWDWGPILPDYLAVTPRPYSQRLPLWVEIDHPEVRSWAARNGVSPFVGADVPLAEAVSFLTRYRDEARTTATAEWQVEPVLERRMVLDGAADGEGIEGCAGEIAQQLWDLRRETGVSHVVWRRTRQQRGRTLSLSQFASQVQPLCQA
ncbi:MAG: LLM class flavin-dependent oxidoreductase [Acidimicrobiia bacterium]|nr:LLM class flavin-dependent oxidoreductase [Acidimicrobiia bacterium]